MYKILIKTCTASNNIWNFYQQDEVDYIATSLEDMKPTALTLLKQYGKKNIKIVKQICGDDNINFLDWGFEMITTEDYMRITDLLDYSNKPNNDWYAPEEVAKAESLIKHFNNLGGEESGK